MSTRTTVRRAAALAACLWTTTAVPAIGLADFDAVALKWNTGESVIDTSIGVHAVPAPVFDGAVNLMLFDEAIPLYLTAGPSGGGIVTFGWLDSTAWTPSDGDGIDLASEFDNPADRVFAAVDSAGNVSLVSAAPFNAGVVLGTTTVTLDPNRPWRLSVELETGLATLWYGEEVVLEATPFGEFGEADAASLGDDLAISVLSGPTETGEATVNDRARDAQLAIEGYPRVLPQRPTTPMIAAPRTFDVMLPGERADLVVYFTSIGTTTASGVNAHITAPAGSGFSVVGTADVALPDLAPGVTTPIVFTIESAPSTAVGSYGFTIDLSGGVSQSLEVWVPVWDVDVTITDLGAGLFSASGATPFNTFSFDLTCPEVFAGGIPAYFDLQHLEGTVTHEVPFRGTFWDQVVFTPVPVPAESPDALFVDGQLVGRDGNNNPVNLSGSSVALFTDSGAFVQAAATASDGSFTFHNVPPGVYRLVVRLPQAIRRLYGIVTSGLFEVGTDSLDLGEVTLPAPPPASQGTYGPPPPSGQGQTGTPPSAPPPPPSNPPPPPPNTTARSAVAGFVTGVIVDLADLGVGPKTFGATLASILIGNGVGTGAGVLADPADQDVFYIGRENTPPLDYNERTTSERLVMDVSISPPLSFTGPSNGTTSYTYTRTTDARSYDYVSGEVLQVATYLPLAVTTAPSGLPSGDVLVTVAPTSPGGTPLTGADALVQGWLVSDDGTVLLGTTILHDDGVEPDLVADDGIHSGLLPRECSLGMKLYVGASRSGFFPENWPSCYGFWSDDLATGPFCPSGTIFEDGFETGDVSRWSNSVPSRP